MTLPLVVARLAKPAEAIWWRRMRLPRRLHSEPREDSWYAQNDKMRRARNGEGGDAQNDRKRRVHDDKWMFLSNLRLKELAGYDVL